MLLDCHELEASGEAAENGRQYKCLKYADVIHMLLCGLSEHFYFKEYHSTLQ